MTQGAGLLWRVEIHETVASTQDIVRARAAAGEAGGLAVQARVQSAGRGRQGTVWTSPPGNLYMSVLLRPVCSAQAAGQLGLLAGVALARALACRAAAGAPVQLKWPNDVLIDGRKAAGILVETVLADGRVEAAIVGMGVNVSAPPEGAAGLAPGESVEGVREAVLAALGEAYGVWKVEGFAPVRAAWLACGPAAGAPIRVGKPPAVRHGGFEGLDAEGRLLFRPEGGGAVEALCGEPVALASGFRDGGNGIAPMIPRQ